MEIDEWVSELVYMWTHGWKTGVSQKPHTEWAKNIK